MSLSYKISLGIWTRMVLFESLLLLLFFMMYKGFTGFVYGLVFIFLNAIVSVPLIPVICLLVKPCKNLLYSVNASMAWLVTLLLPLYFLCAALVSTFMGITKVFKSLDFASWDQFDFTIILLMLLSIVFAVTWGKESFVKFREGKDLDRSVEG